MERAIEAAIAAGQVPSALRSELVGTARALRAGIRCEREPAAPPRTVADTEPAETSEQSNIDRCAQLEQELAALDDQKKQLDEQKHEIEHEHDKDERERAKERLEEQKKAVEEQKKAIEAELRDCEESER